MNRTVTAAIRPLDFLTPRASLPRYPGTSEQCASNQAAEQAALYELSLVIAEDPQRSLRRLLEISLGLCNAGSAGISLLKHDAAGEAVVHWNAVSGALAARERNETPRHLSPCGLCLDLGATILLLRPERVFDSLSETDPPIVQMLIVPLYDVDRRQLGTLWIAHHDSTACCTDEDARILEQLAIHLVLALRLLDYEREEHRRYDQAEAELRQASTSKDVRIRELLQELRSSQAQSLSL